MPEKIPDNIKQEIEKLVKDLNYHNYRYYVLDSPVISDEEYDRLYFHLKNLRRNITMSCRIHPRKESVLLRLKNLKK